jgi:replicative DNA helicase
MFYFPSNQKIYAACLALQRRSQPVDCVTVTTYLDDHQELEAVGGASYPAQLVDRCVSAVNVDRYAVIIREKWLRRRIVEVGHEIAELALDQTIPVEESLSKSQKLLFDLASSKEELRQITLEQGWDAYLNRLENPEAIAKPVPTGLASLDEMVGGMRPGELIIVAGRTGMGKSWVANFLSLKMGATKKPVLFFSAEMGKRSLVDRFICTLSQINLNRVINGTLSEEDMARFITAYDRFRSEYPITIDDTNGSELTLNYIRNQCRKLHLAKGGIGLVVVDYIQFLGDRAHSNRAQDLGVYSRGLKEIAKEFNCCVAALAQINREAESCSDKRPSIQQIKGSGDIEQDADQIWLLYRDEYYNRDRRDGKLEINVGKNRNGMSGVAHLYFLAESGIIVNHPSELKIVR